jgi:hypothetical protein
MMFVELFAPKGALQPEQRRLVVHEPDNAEERGGR